MQLSHKQKLAIAVQLTQAVAFLHSTKPSPLIHLDIKPANILVRMFMHDYNIYTMYMHMACTHACIYIHEMVHINYLYVYY